MKNAASFICSRGRLGGFTLIEMMVTLAVLAILATLAVPSLRTVMANQALSNSASDLMSAALQARSMALKTNRRTIVQPTTGTDWRTGWVVYVDMNTNASYDSTTDTLVVSRESLPDQVSVGTLSGSNDNRSIGLIGFEGDGFLASIGGNYNGSVLLESSYTTRKKYVVVSRSGRVRVCDPSTLPGCTPS